MLGGKLKITSITLSPREVHEFKGLREDPQLILVPCLCCRTYVEPSQLGGDEEDGLEAEVPSSEQRLFWHEDSKPGTLV